MSASGADAVQDEASAGDVDFDALCDRILVGQHLPSVADLIRGCPFLKNDLAADASAFATGMRARLGPPDNSELLDLALTELAAVQDLDRFLVAAAEFEGLVGKPVGKFRLTEAAAARCHFYAAFRGQRGSVHKVAAYAVTALYMPGLPKNAEHAQAAATAGWLLAATGRIEVPNDWSRAASTDFLARAISPSGPGGRLAARMLETRNNLLNGDADIGAVSPIEDELAGERSGPASCLTRAAHSGTTVIVVSKVGNPKTADGARIQEEFRPILGVPLPRLDTTALAAHGPTLRAEFPHAEFVIERVLTQQGDQFAPLLLVGPHGSGKTTFALRLGELLDLPVELLHCGGLADGIAGTSRRWATAEPSLPLSLILARRHASPTIVLDELDKAASTQAGGTLWDSLTGLLDARSASGWRDPYVAAAVDLSGVVWIATANNAGVIPRPLLDRFRVLRFPAPQSQHLPQLAHRLLKMTAAAKGLDPRWASPLDQVETAALATAWRGGSIRRLARLVAAVDAARGRHDAPVN